MQRARCYNHRDVDVFPSACATCNRINTEHKIVRKTIRAFLNAGFALNVWNGGDGNELSKPSRSFDEVWNVIGETDDDKLLVYKLFPPTSETEGHRPELHRVGWVQFVYGNDGWDVISDYAANETIENVLKPINDYANRLGGN